jgi:threonine/homoserine/homoserine lactone efflux protein
LPTGNFGRERSERSEHREDEKSAQPIFRNPSAAVYEHSMTSLSHFTLAVLLLLLVPGPTNTLLLTAGTTHGLRKSLPLLAAEALGYLVTVHLLIFLNGLLIEQVSAAKPAIQIACALYLVFLAVRIWLGSFSAAQTPRAISFWDVLITTLLNPKAFILAFVIVPYAFDTNWRFAAPYFACMMATIVSAGLAWVALGALVKSGLVVSVPSTIIQRVSAVALVLFAGLLIARL